MASVRPRTTKAGVTTYAVLFRHGGRQTSETFENEEGANNFKVLVDTLGPDRALDLLEEMQPSTGGLTVDELAEKWLEAKRVERDAGLITPHTYHSYERDHRNAIKPFMGHMAAAYVTENVVADWIDWLLTKKGYEPKTILNRHGQLHQMFDWASSSRRRLVPNNPCTETELPRRKKKKPKGMRLGEVLHLLEVAYDETSPAYDPDAADVFAFMASTGWRIQEAIALVAYSVEFEEGENGEELVYATMDNVDRRMVGFVPDAKSAASFGRRTRVVEPGAEVLRRRVKGLKGNDLVFTAMLGRKDMPEKRRRGRWTQSTLRDARWHALIEAAGLDGRGYTPHSLRHAHVPLCLKAGMSMPEVQRRLGHESIKTTYDIYGGMIEEMMNEGTAERLGSLLSGKGGKVIPFKRKDAGTEAG